MRVKIAELIVELNPKYNDTLLLSNPFQYNGSRATDIELKVVDDYLNNLLSKSNGKSSLGQLENYAFSTAFSRKALRFNTMLIHSSALIYNDGAYLFSANSGVGKSTHTKLWLQAFGDKVHIMNDDKPVVRLYENKAIVYGTPFDGGSGIAMNESYPLKAIIFLERGDYNSVRVPDYKEIINNLYFQTAHMVNFELAEKMLVNIEKLLDLSDFYILTCNMNISAVFTAFECIVNNEG